MPTTPTPPPALNTSLGEPIDLPDFYTDFEHHYHQASEFWKLERTQHFAEPGDDSWQALNHGDWNTALHRIHARRDHMTASHQRATKAGLTARRIRFVEHPIGPYLQWELHLLHQRDAITGGTINILTDTPLTEHEHTYGATLPEICTIDDTVMYQHQYDQHGVIKRNLRYTDPDLITTWRNYTSALWLTGTPLTTYFTQHVKDLPTPTLPEQLPDDYLEQRDLPGPLKL